MGLSRRSVMAQFSEIWKQAESAVFFDKTELDTPMKRF
jgi:hypothetical protein